MTAARILRELTDRAVPVVAPLALDPLSALIAQSCGMQALYLGGGTLGYVKTGTEANLNLTDMAQTGMEIRAACQLPLILDAQCGWGDPMHMQRTLNVAEAVGFAALEIEDQIMPKRAHHHIGIEHLIPEHLMIEKIKVAVGSRRDPDTIIIARTNACRGAGVEEALKRGEAYRNAGADMLMLLMKSPDEARFIGERIGGPLVYMTLSGISSIGMSPEDLSGLGYKIVVEGAAPFYARHLALRNCYSAIAHWQADPSTRDMYKPLIEDVHHLIELNGLLEIERRTVEK